MVVRVNEPISILKNAKFVIFGAATKKLLFIGIYNVCSVSGHKKQPPPNHQCFKNWSNSSCAMEADVTYLIVSQIQVADRGW